MCTTRSCRGSKGATGNSFAVMFRAEAILISCCRHLPERRPHPPRRSLRWIATLGARLRAVGSGLRRTARAAGGAERSQKSWCAASSPSSRRSPLWSSLSPRARSGWCTSRRDPEVCYRGGTSEGPREATPSSSPAPPVRFGLVSLAHPRCCAHNVMGPTVQLQLFRARLHARPPRA